MTSSPTVADTPPTLTLQQAADRLGVHYMTAYRYVKLGLLYAEKRKGSWSVPEAELVEFQKASEQADAPNQDGKPPAPNDEALAREQSNFEAAVLRGDEPEAWKILQRRVSSSKEKADAHVDLVAQTMASIGERWAGGEITIAQEHQASEVAARLLARHGPAVATPGRRRGRVIVGGAPGDPHRLPTSLFSALIRSHGVDVTDLGANVPPEAFLEAARREGGDLVVCMSVTGPDHGEGVRAAVAALRSAFPDIVIAIGGGAITSKEQANELGADVWHDDPHVGAELVAAAAQSGD